MNIIFMGTPDFAVYSLNTIYENNFNVQLVITQEDKPQNRGKKIQMPPVKKRALELGLDVYQPNKIRDNDVYEKIKKLKPDLIVVTAYGKIIPKEILDIPTYGCINVHASLLPKLRGAAPIQFSIINGESITGLTTMYMDEGLDTGDMIYKEELIIEKNDNAKTLELKLAELSKKILLKTIESIQSGTAPRIKQNSEEANYAPLISKEMGRIDFTLDGEKICNLIKGLDPWPSAYTTLDGEVVKLYSPEIGVTTDSKDFGKILNLEKNFIEIVANNNTIKIYEIQFPNKKRMKISEFINGNGSKNLKDKFFK